MPNEVRVKRKKEERLEAAAAKTPKLDIYFGSQRLTEPHSPDMSHRPTTTVGSVAKTTTEHPVAEFSAVHVLEAII